MTPKILNPSRIKTLIVEAILAQILSFSIQLFVSPDIFKNVKMKTLIDNAIIIGTVLVILLVVFQIIYWYVTGLNKFVKQQNVINKFNNIMISRFEENYKAHICSVLDNDIKLFTKEELKYLNEYLKEKEILKIEMKGRNETLGLVL